MKNFMTVTRAKLAPPCSRRYLFHRHGSNSIISGSTIEWEPDGAIQTQCSLPINVNSPRCDQRLGQKQALERSPLADNLFYDFVRAEEIKTAHEIEVQGFPPEEADTFELLKFHQEAAPELFLGAYIPTSTSSFGADIVDTTNFLHRRLVAYVFATLSSIPRYTQKSMTSHIPNTTTICCHTLCVDKDFRGFSIGMKLLEEFTHMCRKRGIYDRMLFISKEKLLPVYEKIGFTTLGPAEVKLGNDVWYEMCINFRE